MHSHLSSRFPLRFLAFFLLLFTPGFDALLAQEPKPIVLDPSYNHDRWKTRPTDIVRKFEAYTVSFDSDDDDNDDGTPDRWAIPQWVAYEVKRHAKLPAAPGRPSIWLTEEALFADGIAPKDASYQYAKALKPKFPYDRGHMCPKITGFRLGAIADWNTHTVLNAVPQWNTINSGIWKSLESKVNNWADKYGSVWVVCGPIIKDRTVTKWLGQTGEVPVAIPDEIFKIVIKEGATKATPDVLAFIYPNSVKKGVKPKERLVSVDEIEEKTGLNFLSSLSKKKQNQIESSPATSLWK